MDPFKDIYKRICRVCMKPSKQKMVCLLDMKSDDRLSHYGKCIRYFAKVNLKSNNGLPTDMCQNCLQLLRNAVKFKLTCERTEKQMKELLTTHSKNDPNFKETFVQSVLYLNYFPEKARKKKKSTEIKCEITIDRLKEDSGNDMEDDEQGFEDNDTGGLEDNDNDNECSNDYEANEVMKKETKVEEEKKIDELFDLMEKTVGSGHVVDIDEKELTNYNEDVDGDSQATTSGKRKRRYPVKKVTCPMCSKIFSTPAAMKAHMDRHGLFKFMCEVCGRAYPTKKELSLHQSARHDIGNIFPCEYCPYKASRNLDLIEHVRVHTGERPFACEKCGLTFRRKFIYKKHLVHHYEKKIQCPHCPAKFYHKSHMSSHCNSVHERRYVYSCVRCSSMYAKAASLRKHYLTKHDIPREEQILNKVYQNPKPPVRNLNRRVIES